ncbi:protein FAM174C [Festucalex cinctus]
MTLESLCCRKWPLEGAPFKCSRRQDVMSSRVASLHFLVGVYFVNKADRRGVLRRRLQFSSPTSSSTTFICFRSLPMAAPARPALVGPLLLLLLPVCQTLAAPGAAPQTTAEISSNSSSAAAGSGAAGAGSAGREGKTLSGFKMDSLMVQRAFYVLVAITAVGLLYFLIRAVRVKKAAPRKKYGLLAHSDDSMELTAATASDEDDDNTLYEARALRR